MSRKRHRKNNRQKAQKKRGIWACIKDRTLDTVGHHLFGNWVALATLVITFIGVIIGVVHSYSSSESLSSTGGNNDKILHGVSSTQDIERMISDAIGKATITNVVEICANPSKKLMPKLMNSSELDYLADRAFRAWKRMDITNAVMLARSANSLIMGKLPSDEKEFDVYIESNVWMNVQRVYPILIDDAMSNEDYDGMSHMADLLIASSPTYWAYPQAMKDIALLRKSGCRLFFFSPEKIRELRAMPKNDLEQYLTMLTTRGYLAPYFLNYQQQDVEPVEWGKFFDLGHPLSYLLTFRVRTKDASGNEITSNELYGQWVGLGKYELIDVNAEAARSMGLSESQTPRTPIRLTGTITQGYPRAVAFSDDERIKVPEPSSGMLLIIGLAAIALRRQTWSRMVARLGK